MYPTAKPSAHTRNPALHLSPPKQKPTHPRVENPLSADAEPVPATPPRAQDSRHEQRYNNTRKRTPHTFPDYGSVKGAVKMPPPGRNALKTLEPIRALNSLGGAQGSKRETSHRPNNETPSAKRHRPEPSFMVAPPSEQIHAAVHDIKSRSGYPGSQGGSNTFSDPYSDRYKGGTSHRRPRQKFIYTNLAHNLQNRLGNVPSLPRGTDEIEDCEDDNGYYDADELANFVERGEKPSISPRDHTTTTHLRLPSAGLDGADSSFFPKPASAQTGTKTLKRPMHSVSSEDELGSKSSTKQNIKSKRRSAGNLDRTAKRSLSRRGDIIPTKFLPSCGIQVRSAVCQPWHNYLTENGGGRADGESPGLLFLRSISGSTPELRAYAADGQEAPQHQWLKITSKTKSLHWNRGCEIIKTTQASESKIPVGGSQVLTFFNPDDTAQVVRWVENNMRTVSIIHRDERARLDQEYDNLMKQILQAQHDKARLEASDKTITHPSTPRCSTNATAGILEKGPSEGMEFGEDRAGSGRGNATPTIGSSVNGPRRTAFRDQMRATVRPAQTESSNILSDHRTTKRSLRSRHITETPITVEQYVPAIPRWTHVNPSWAENWKGPLTYKRTTVDKDDISRLDEGQCLNDNLIAFGFRYLCDEFPTREKNIEQRVYVHNTYFYEKLRSDKSYKGKINYDGVKNWTAKVDLLSFDYIIVPVNEHYHWWLAIICNPGRLDPEVPRPSDADTVESSDTPGIQAPSDVEIVSDSEGKPQPSHGDTATTGLSQLSLDSPKFSNTACDPVSNLTGATIVDLVEGDTTDARTMPVSKKTKRGRKISAPGPRVYDPREPRIITLDSLGQAHSASVTALKYYLEAEFEHKKGKILADLPPQIGMKAVGIPEQNNFCDCGVYILGYMQEFVKNPDWFVGKLLRREKLDWIFEPSRMRQTWRDTVFSMHKSYRPTPPENNRETLSASGSEDSAQAPISLRAESISETTSKYFTKSPDKPNRNGETGRELTNARSGNDLGSTVEPAGPQNIDDTPELGTPGHGAIPTSSPSQDGTAEEVSLLPIPPSGDAAIPSIEEPLVEDEPPLVCSPGTDEGFVKRLSSLSSTSPGPRTSVGSKFSLPKSQEKARGEPSAQFTTAQFSLPSDAVEEVKSGRRKNWFSGPKQGHRIPTSKISAVEHAEIYKPDPIDLTEED